MGVYPLSGGETPYFSYGDFPTLFHISSSDFWEVVPDEPLFCNELLSF